MAQIHLRRAGQLCRVFEQQQNLKALTAGPRSPTHAA